MVQPNWLIIEWCLYALQALVILEALDTLRD